MEKCLIHTHLLKGGVFGMKGGREQRGSKKGGEKMGEGREER